MIKYTIQEEYTYTHEGNKLKHVWLSLGILERKEFKKFKLKNKIKNVKK